MRIVLPVMRIIGFYHKRETAFVGRLSRNVVGGASIFFPIGAGALLAYLLIVLGAVPQVPAASLCEFAGTNRANECSGKTCFDKEAQPNLGMSQRQL